MRKPKILMSGKLNLPRYAAAIDGAGGIAVAQYMPVIDDDYDGLVLCGGNDIDPAFFGEPINGSVDVDRKLDEWEFSLMKSFLEADKPILGICRGCQLINVYFDGTLCQHLPNAADHKSNADQDLIHPVQALKGSLAEKLYGTEFVVNSVHHQAIQRLGTGLKATMFAESVIEGIEHESLPVLGVQWHPERICGLGKETVDGSLIFAYFVKMCHCKISKHSV